MGEGTLRKIGLLVNPRIVAATGVANRVAALAGAAEVASSIMTLAEAEEASASLRDFELVFTFGGDGTILRASKICAPLGIPIVGVALGQLGFLAELQVDRLDEDVPKVLRGECHVEERLMVHSELYRDGRLLSTNQALNDVVVVRGAVPRVIELVVDINDVRLTKWVADGAIVSTPTGSTAYSLASGGPVAHPEVRAMILTPVAAHLNILRSLVLPENAVVRLSLTGKEGAVLSIDGQINFGIVPGDHVTVTTSPDLCRLVRLQVRSYFVERLVERLQRKD